MLGRSLVSAYSRLRQYLVIIVYDLVSFANTGIDKKNIVLMFSLTGKYGFIKVYLLQISLSVTDKFIHAL